MRRVKSDRWDNLIERLPNDNGWVRLVDAATLLRREHRAVVRAIKKHRAWACEQGCSSTYENALLDVLHIIKKRAR